jgi:hypothetical protein
MNRVAWMNGFGCGWSISCQCNGPSRGSCASIRMELQDGSITMALTPDPVLLAFHTEFRRNCHPWASELERERWAGTNWLLRLRTGIGPRDWPTDPEHGRLLFL